MQILLILKKTRCFKCAFESLVCGRTTGIGRRNMAVRTTGRHAGDTKSRILDAAETLFIECGYEAMSLRQITSRAEVNLAAVNYHFGSKEALIHAMLSRRLDRLNQERVKLLERFDSMLGRVSRANTCWARCSFRRCGCRVIRGLAARRSCVCSDALTPIRRRSFATF
jgi:AcrR family transcriptional regulator